jgi:hypothetical protein
MSCKTVIEMHVFKTIGEFEGKPVISCAHCPLTIVDLDGLRGDPFVTVELGEEPRVIYHPQRKEENK